MFHRLRVWVPGSLIGLFGSAGVFAGNPTNKDGPPVPCPAPCPTPGTKIIVQMSPPEITFKSAPPTCVRAPGAHVQPSIHCYPVSMPGPLVPTYSPGPAYAPAYAPAPVYAPMPAYAPIYAPAPGYAPAYGPAPAYVAGPGPMAPAPGFGMPQAAPCGSGGWGAALPQGNAFGVPSGQFGPGGTGSALDELAAQTEGRLAYQRAVLKRQHAAAREQLSGLEKQAAAYGLAPAGQAGLKPKDEKGTQNAPAPAESSDQVLKDIQELRAELKQHTDNLYKLANHQLIEMDKIRKEQEKQRKEIPPSPK